MPDETNDRRKAWRHLFQCVLAEHAARQHRQSCRWWQWRERRAAEKRLVAEGLRLDAAIDALDDTLTERKSA